MCQFKTVIYLLAVLFFRQAVAQSWEDLQGRNWAPELNDDTWIVVNYWAVWCAPCREEVPELNRLSRVDATIQVLGVNFDQPKELSAAHAARERLEIGYPVLRSSPHALYEQQLPLGLPATDLLAPGGLFRVRLLGPQSAESIQGHIAAFKREAVQ